MAISDVDGLKDWLVALRPQYRTEAPTELVPDPAFLLGNRWADYSLATIVTLAFPVLRRWLESSTYEPLGLAIMFGSKVSVTSKLMAKQQETMKKWNEACFKITVFTMLTAIALAASFGKPWFWETRYFWSTCYAFPPCKSAEKGAFLLYVAETGFYAHAIHYAIYHETRRKAWLESLIHHVATLCLLVYSYYVNFTLIGVMVMLMHDVSDIFLQAAKLARYARRTRAAVGLFVTFVVVWVVTCDIIFPAVIIRSTLSESIYYAPVEVNTEPHYTIFNTLLILLQILHIITTYRIVKIAVHQVQGIDKLSIQEGKDLDDLE